MWAAWLTEAESGPRVVQGLVPKPHSWFASAPVAASENYTEESSPVLVVSVGDLHLVGDLLKLTSFLLGPFPCKAITKIFWLTTRQG